MKITKVTMTGADNSIAPEKLFEITRKYPFVEWGILVSRNSQGNNRFPSKLWMDKLALEKYYLDLSCHLCGTYVKEILMGSTRFINELGDIWKRFSRVQINTHGIHHQYDKHGLIQVLTEHSDKEFIFQYDNVNKQIVDAVSPSCKNISALFDLSHGAGILPKEWVKPLEGIKCGYAGGLSPENVQQQIKLIEQKVGDGEIWIDMETQIRSNNDQQFDLVKVEKVLEICLNTQLCQQ